MSRITRLHKEILGQPFYQGIKHVLQEDECDYCPTCEFTHFRGDKLIEGACLGHDRPLLQCYQVPPAHQHLIRHTGIRPTTSAGWCSIPSTLCKHPRPLT